MSTTLFDAVDFACRSTGDATDTAFDHVTEVRLQRAATHVRPYLARLPDTTLRVLGFAPREIARIRSSAGSVGVPHI